MWRQRRGDKPENIDGEALFHLGSIDFNPRLRFHGDSSLRRVRARERERASTIVDESPERMPRLSHPLSYLRSGVIRGVSLTKL